MALVYAKAHDGRDLVRDLLLLAKKERGRDRERNAAINHYMAMYWQWNSEMENAFYEGVKEVFGKTALVATHPTWFPYPGELEATKNGLDWWACRRDLAQTDESTPFSVRTALAHHWDSPLWYNMYYSTSIESYQREMWSSVLAGGRINFHPLYPAPLADGNTAILRGDLMRAEQRIRLLNYITEAPVESPVLLLFGHTAALNWTGDSFGKTGVEIANELWEAGYYTDLMPTSVINQDGLGISSGERIFGRVSRNRDIWPYNFNRERDVGGAGAYDAVILYHPQFEQRNVAALFSKPAARNFKTALYRVGDWTHDFDGNPSDAEDVLSPKTKVVSEETCAKEVIAHLKSLGVEPQTPGRMRGEKGFPDSVVPQPSGQCQLVDGTVILASGEKEMMGDPIQKTIKVRGFEVTLDAIGVVGVQLQQDGSIYALAAGGLKLFKSAKQTIALPERLDVAIYKEPFGDWRGVVHGHDGAIPEPLLALTKNWTRVRVPTPYVDPPVSVR